MANRQAALVPVERAASEITATRPRVVYLGDHPTAGAGHYVLVDTRSEATAWLKETSPDVYKLYDTEADSDGILYLVNTSPNTIVL